MCYIKGVTIMKSDKKILVAFLLNLFFSVFEIVGGFITGSVAILSDAIHDFGDSISIGISFFLEKISKKKPDNIYTYGYVRYSVLGSVITTTILLAGSVLVIFNAVQRILNPAHINYNGMIIFAVVGTVVNLVAALFTKDGDSLNQKAVNLHMLEDVLGWIAVLIGAVVMKFTDFVIIDPILSICVAVFIFINALKNFKSLLDVFLEKIPEGIDINEIRKHLLHIEGVEDVHHIHIRSMDGVNNFATMHVVADGDFIKIKGMVKEELSEHGISHATVEMETKEENCEDVACKPYHTEGGHHHHHHHHH